MDRNRYPDLVLGLAPSSRGLAFVLLEGPLTPFDWGVMPTPGTAKNAQIIKRVEKLITLYHPQVVVLEDIRSRTARRSARLHALVLAITTVAQNAGVEVRFHDRKAIRACFATIGARTKYEIALSIANQIPAFRHRLPPIRKIWMSEDPRQTLFDAAALAMVHFVKIE